MWPATSCRALRPGLKRVGEEFEGEVKDFGYVNDTSLGRLGVTTNTVGDTTFVRREVGDTGIVPPRQDRPWCYRRTGAPRRRKTFRSWKMSTSASLEKQG